MDEDSNFEYYITRYLEDRLNIHLSEQQIYSYSDSENESMSVQHNLPRESFPMIDDINDSSAWNSCLILEDSQRLLQYSDSCPRTENVSIAVPHSLPTQAFMPSSQYNRVPQETLSGVPSFSTPAFTGQGEVCNTEELGMNQSSSNFETIQPQEGDVLRQNLLSSQLPTFDMYFSSELPASNRYPAIPSTSERFLVDPYDSDVNEPFSVPNLNHSDEINESSSELGDSCQGNIHFDHLNIMNCHPNPAIKDSVEECHQNRSSAFNHDCSEERIFIGRQNSTGLIFNSPGRVDAASGNGYYYNQNPTSQNILDIPGMCYSSNKLRGAENPNHDPNARSNVCVNVYATKGEVIRHKKVKHGTKESFHCDYCGKIFPNITRLKIHRRMHTGEKPFMCKVCKKCLARKSNLRRHESVHTEVKTFICEVCNKGFAQNSNLRVHERVHTGEKPFMCQECNKGFAQSSALKRHEKTHTREKHFMCLVCNKRFVFKTNLRKHDRTHKTFKYE